MVSVCTVLPSVSTGMTSLARRPEAMAAAARWWERTASSSCASRGISLRTAISSADSPISLPVVRSAMRGARGSTSDTGASLRSMPSTSPAVALPYISGTAACTSFCGSFTSALLVESEPPAMITSASPRSMAAAARVTACSPEVQARVTVIASTFGGSLRSRAISRPTLGARPGRMTPPQTMASMSARGSG